jgi:tRNA A37 threonylcarbamoyltransferase TsaD
MLVLMDAKGKMKVVGDTRDDAAGEAFDKAAKLLGLGYPGGRALDDLARTGNRNAFPFPRGMTGPCDEPFAFSFSGLKTAVARYVEKHPDAPTADVVVLPESMQCLSAIQLHGGGGDVTCSITPHSEPGPNSCMTLLHVQIC